MLRKRSLTFHEKRVRYFMFVFGAAGVIFTVGLILLVNRSPLSIH